MEETSATLDLIARWGYVTIFIIIAVENVEFFGSFPTSLIAAGMGALAVEGIFDPVSSIILLTVASVVGDVIGYIIGIKIGRPVLLRWARHIVTPERLEKAEAMVKKWGPLSVFFTRFIIASIQAIVNIIAGITRMRFIPFLIAATLGEFVWTLIYFFLGYFAWPSVQGVLERIGAFGPIGVILGIVVILFIYFVVRIRKRPKQ